MQLFSLLNLGCIFLLMINMAGPVQTVICPANRFLNEKTAKRFFFLSVISWKRLERKTDLYYRSALKEKRLREDGRFLLINECWRLRAVHTIESFLWLSTLTPAFRNGWRTLSTIQRSYLLETESCYLGRERSFLVICRSRKKLKEKSFIGCGSYWKTLLNELLSFLCSFMWELIQWISFLLKPGR